MTFKLRTLVVPAVAFLIAFPVVYLAVLSLAADWRFPAAWPPTLTLRHWVAALTGQQELLGSLGLSLFLALTVATLATGLGFLTSRFVAYHPRRDWWLLLTYFPFALSPVVFAAFLYNYFLRLSLAGNVVGVLLGHLLLAYPFAIIFFSSYWNRQLKTMEELVATLGGTQWQAFRHVLLPVSRGVLLICFFQTFLISWFEYGLTRVIGIGKVPTLTLRVFQYVGEANPYYAALSSILLIVPPLGLLWFNKRFVFGRML